MAEKNTVVEKMRTDAVSIFEAGLQAVSPGTAVRRFLRRQGNHLRVQDEMLDLTDFQNVYVVGAGKATAAMAEAAESVLGNRISDGVVVVKYDHVAALKYTSQVEAAHPVPDENGRKGAEKIMALLSRADENDLVICLISGGGSALTPLPAPGLSVADKQKTAQVLLACGASIHEINAIRKHMSGIKGGLLARAAHPARLLTLILSDVVGDDLDVIASGPGVPDSSTFSDCMAIIEKYNLVDQLPASVTAHIRSGMSGDIPETPKPGEAVFNHTQNVIVGSNSDAIRTAGQAAKQFGYNTLTLSSMIEGETREVARVHGAIAKEILKTGNPVPRPACVLSGGETTVTIRGTGKGGRNQEFALAAAIEIAPLENVVIFSAGTDGTDGPTDAAGAIADSSTVTRALERAMDPQAFLFNNDAYHFFKPLGDLVITGPTRTNVMDLRILLVY